MEINRLIQLEDVGMMPPLRRRTPGLHPRPLGVRPGAVIAEIQTTSPSRGDINMALSPEQVASPTKAAGAAALSVLTEETYFKGSLDYLTRMACAGLPMLRKDFILHPVQVIGQPPLQPPRFF